MLKPIYYLAIFPIFFSACINQDSNRNSDKNSNDSTNNSSFKEDSLIVSVNHEEQIKDTLFIDGSVQYSYDTLSLEFNLSDLDYEIVYQKDEQLFFFDIKSHNKIEFPDTSRILDFSFSSDGNTLYYRVRNKEAMQLKRASLNGLKANISTLRCFDKPMSEFISPISGEVYTMHVRGDTLSFGHGFNSDSYSISGFVYIVAKADSSYEIKSLPAQYYQESSKNYKQHYTSISKKFKLIKRNDYKELFLIENSDTIQMSDIDTFLKENYKERDYDLGTYYKEKFDKWVFETLKFSPDGSKIIYSYPCVFYDFLHGPTYIVNMNGDFLKLLTDDGGFSIDNQRPQEWLPDGNNILFYKYENDDRGWRSGLYMTINSENDVMKIEENVDKYKIR